MHVQIESTYVKGKEKLIEIILESLGYGGRLTTDFHLGLVFQAST